MDSGHEATSGMQLNCWPSGNLAALAACLPMTSATAPLVATSNCAFAPHPRLVTGCARFGQEA